ncbi:MAG: amidohydrolase family protein [Proteobacteria bacterium]|nr:amidohydrolase family protein [Pseudomonadota bacterium]
MIIDFHAHWWPSDEYVHSKDAWKMTILGVNQGYYKPLGFDMEDAELEQQFFDPDGSVLLKRMEEAGVDKTVILPLDWEKVNGASTKHIMEQNRAYSELSEKHPDKIIAFFSIHPERENAPQSFKTAVSHWGMKGLKLYPPTGFYPTDKICTPFYEICLAYDLPVLFHGTTSPMSTEPYCHPDGFSQLAATFPELKIVVAHSGGREWQKEAIRACREHENIYLDISGLQSVKEKASFLNLIKYLFDSLGTFQKVLFGTDSPIFNGICEVKDMVTTLGQADVPEEELSNLMGNAGRRILKL